MDLDELRGKIDAVDEKIVSLLNERYRTVIEIGAWKKNNSGSAVYVPEREKAVLERLCTLNHGPMSNTTLRGVYREIMSGALALEYPVKVAYPGPETAPSRQAALSKFGRSVGCIPKQSLEEVFQDVASGCAEYGCVPVENSTEGADGRTLDLLGRSPDVMIRAEINLRIHLCLLSAFPQQDIRKLYASARSFSHCRRYLQKNLPGVEQVETASDAKALGNAANDPGSAAIASPAAAEMYGMSILHGKIEDNPDNRTRFLVISRGNKISVRTGSDKTSLCFSIKNRVGALYDCLLPFRDQNIALSMIESRPSGEKNWEYLFFIDLLGHAEDEDVRQSLARLQERTGGLRILGSYPRGIEEE